MTDLRIEAMRCGRVQSHGPRAMNGPATRCAGALALLAVLRAVTERAGLACDAERPVVNTRGAGSLRFHD